MDREAKFNHEDTLIVTGCGGVGTGTSQFSKRQYLKLIIAANIEKIGKRTQRD